MSETLFMIFTISSLLVSWLLLLKCRELNEELKFYRELALDIADITERADSATFKKSAQGK